LPSLPVDYCYFSIFLLSLSPLAMLIPQDDAAAFVANLIANIITVCQPLAALLC